MRTNAVLTIYNAKKFQEKPGCPVAWDPAEGIRRVGIRPEIMIERNVLLKDHNQMLDGGCSA
jgi:hypothetical protein